MEQPIYIKKHPKLNSYVPATEHDATGVSTPQGAFALMGKTLDDLEQAVIVKSDGGIDIDSNSNINDLLVQYVLDLEYENILNGLGAV